MKPEEKLCEQVDRYRALSEKFGADAQCVKEAFSTVLDLIIVEAYFMKSVRRIVTDEEMSGYILFIRDDIRDIVDSFISGVGSFMGYLASRLEYRAMTYIDSTSRKRAVCYSYEHYYMPYNQEVCETAPEDIYFDRLKRKEQLQQKKRAMLKLRFLCVYSQTKRRYLYIFLCTMLPYLSMDMIDEFCDLLNCDKRQTLAIAEYLALQSRDGLDIKNSRSYLLERVDYFWMRLIEMESRSRMSLDTGRYDKTISYQRAKLHSMNQMLENQRMHVKYPIIGQLLNMDSSKVAYAVFNARKLLQIAGNDDAIDSESHHIIKLLSRISPERMASATLQRFEPFKVFGIKDSLLPYAC